MIQVRELSKRYEAERNAVSSVSLTVRAGEIYTLLGAGGAGKSTLLNILLGALKPNSGTALINHIDSFRNSPEVRRFLAYLPARLALCDVLTPVENVRYYLRLSGSQSRSKIEIVNALRDVGVPERSLTSQFKGLTPRERQGVGIALAVLRRVPALLADEPADGLDPADAIALMNLLHQMKSAGTAILLATRDTYLCRFSDRVGVLRQGWLIFEKPVPNLRSEELERIYHGVRA